LDILGCFRLAKPGRHGEFKPGDRIKVVARDGALEFAKK
jgi:hypothetical protein